MKTRTLRYTYALLTLVGLVVPTSWLLPWLTVHGLDLGLLGKELFINQISSAFGADVLISAVVVVVFAFMQRHTVRLWWMAAAATLLLGVSVGLPLLLFLRESTNEQPPTL